MSRQFRFALMPIVGIVLTTVAMPTGAQQMCPAPPPLAVPITKNIFAPQQEVELGDIEAEQFERNVHVLQDPELSAYANGIAARILAHLPPTTLKIRVFIVDLPAVNAFTVAGGRIYLTREAIAFTRNEDELAGVLAHEMGHALTHQQAIDMTRAFEALGIDSVGDRSDIFSDFNRFLDNVGRHPDLLKQTAKEEEPHQYVADKVALYALAQAGYSPQAFIDFFDRLAQTQGKTGNRFTDFLGMTPPSEKRLRQLHADLEGLPSQCRPAAAAVSTRFQQWQTNVITYSDLGREENLRGLLLKRDLVPPLRSDLRQVKFSPDGRYLLAQDESSVFIFGRDPLALVIRIDARDARIAHFTPDSQNVVFDTQSMRVEKWNIPDKKRTAVHEIAIPGGCIQTLLSHNGQTFACVDRTLGISLLDVSSGSSIFTKKKYFVPDQLGPLANYVVTLSALMGLSGADIVHMSFSPDDHYFVAGFARKSLAFDLTSRAPMSLRGSLPFVVTWDFAFLSVDKIVGNDRTMAGDSGVFEFPSGHMIQHFQLGTEHIQAPTHSDTIVVSPIKDGKAGLVDLQTHKILLTLDSTAIDVYDQTFAMETRTGEIALYDLATTKEKSLTVLPQSPLGNPRAWTVSPDLNWLAMSDQTRGAVWDLSKWKGVYLISGFGGADFDGDSLYVDLTKLGDRERSIARLSLDRRNASLGTTIPDKTLASQYGPYFVEWVPQEKNGLPYYDARLEVHDIRDNHLLWTRTFPNWVPRITFAPWANTAVLVESLMNKEAHDEINADPVLKGQFKTIRNDKAALLLEVLDARTGATTGRLLVDTGEGSFQVQWAKAVQDWILVADTENRIHIYSLSTGLEKGVVFGNAADVSVPEGVLVVQNKPGQIDVYHLPTLEPAAPLVFSAPISAVSFSEGGKRLFVLNANEVVYIFDVGALAQSEPPPQRKKSPGKAFSDNCRLHFREIFQGPTGRSGRYAGGHRPDSATTSV